MHWKVMSILYFGFLGYYYVYVPFSSRTLETAPTPLLTIRQLVSGKF